MTQASAIDVPRSALRKLESAAWSDTGLTLTTPPKMRDLAHRLLNYEAGAVETSEQRESRILRVYDKLRQSLGTFAGAAGFQSLASRALALAISQAPRLSAVRICADGALQGLGQDLGILENQIGMNKDRAREYPDSDDGIVLIEHILGLLHTFLGEALTLSLLRNAWPGAAFDDRDSGSGRNS